MPLRPVPMDRQELADLLKDMAWRVQRGDSFGGFIEYDALDPELPPDKDFYVRASYRIGNTEGQGGVRMVGEVVPEDVDPVEAPDVGKVD